MSMTDSDTSVQMMDRLADAAWDRLATTPFGSLRMEEVALDAGMDPHAARACAGSVMALVLHQLSRMDRRAALESLADIEDAGEVPVRDKIMEAMMHRFEVYAPHRAQIACLDRAARVNPMLGLRLFHSLSQAMRMILGMAGDELAGLRGEARVKGMTGVAMIVARTWQKDDTPDLAQTMKQIDSQLGRAEEWGRSLRVLGAGAGWRGPGRGRDEDVPAQDVGEG